MAALTAATKQANNNIMVYLYTTTYRYTYGYSTRQKANRIQPNTMLKKALVWGPELIARGQNQESYRIRSGAFPCALAEYGQSQ